MMLFRLLSWPYLRKHVLRWLLTITGIVLGVAVFVAIQSANRAVLDGFNRTVDRIAGAAELQITAGEFGFDESVLERVQSIPEVGVAVPMIEATVNPDNTAESSLLILGVDMTGDQSLRQYDFETSADDTIPDPLVFLAQPDSILLSAEFARRNNLALNDRLPLETIDGLRQFTVRGVMETTGLASAFGGNVAVMDVYAAQHVFGRGRRFDRIDLKPADGVSAAECQARIAAVLGPGFDVGPPSSRGQTFSDLTSSFATGLEISSVFALIVGMFIIYNSFSIAVTQRRSEIGVLRALGASRGQVQRIFLMESALAGVAGSVLGAGAGLLVARVLAAAMSGIYSQILGGMHHVDGVALDGPLIGGSIVLGTLTSVAAAWLPARAASEMDPVRSLKKGEQQLLSARESRMRFRAALLMTGIALAVIPWDSFRPLFYAGFIAAILAGLLMTPTAAGLVVRGLRPAMSRLFPVEGTLAADSLLGAPRRTSATVAALMLSLSMVIGFGGATESIYGSLERWMDEVLNPDLFISPSSDIASRTFEFREELGVRLEGVPGVDQVQFVRNARTSFRGKPVMIVSVEIEKLAAKVRRTPIAGDLDDMYRRSAAGQGVMISENLYRMRGIKLNELIEIQAPYGAIRLPVTGVTSDFTDNLGTIVLDRAVFKKHWGDDSVNVFRVYAREGEDVTALRQRIAERFSGEKRFVILSNAELRRYILRITDQWFQMTYNQIGIAILVAVLGIVNTLTVSITDRRRELGVLQAVGGLRSQIRRTIWIEALAIGTVGLVLGVALGAVNLNYTIGMMSVDFAGISMEYRAPIGLIVLLVPVILAAAFVAGVGPAESAVRGRLVEALEYE